LSDIGQLEQIRQQGKLGLSKALAQLEREPYAHETLDLLSQAWRAPEAKQCHVIGLTGPPGVGKSTLTNALIRAWRKAGRRVCVIAVDPSSKQSGGALLGDRTRIITDPEDEGVYVRSMAARDRLGGLSALTASATALARALFDIVLVETVGVGQSETEIADLADSVVFCIQPGSGDSLQFMKAGIMEIPDILVVTKADVGSSAERALSDVRGAISLTSEAEATIVLVSAQSGEGIDELLQAMEDRWQALQTADMLDQQRRRQDHSYLVTAVRERFGREGLAVLKEAMTHPFQGSPFKREAELVDTLRTQGWR